jgi:EmrB/QacA subfamily drug resistance transporter
MTNNWKILFVTTSATSLIFLDNTIMPVALPTIQKEFALSENALVWIVNSYLLALTALMMIGGRLYDLFGMRRIYYWGLAIFTLGSIAGGISTYNWMLLSGRILQGVGGALIVPTTGAILINVFDKNNRAKALGTNTGISAIFLILGPAIGGFLTEYADWRYIFWINLPVLLFGFIMTGILLPKGQKKAESFHMLGAVPLALTAIGLVVPLMEGQKWGWLSPISVAFFSGAFFCLLLFIWASRRTAYPIVDATVFRKPFFMGSTIAIFLTQFLLMVTVFWAIYFQNVLNYSPVETGFIIMSATLPVAILAPLGGYFTDRYGAKWPMLVGFFLLAAAMVWFAFVAYDRNILRLIPGLLGFGCGIPMILSPAFVTAMSRMPASKLGTASSFTTTLRQLGSTLGVAVMSAIYYTFQKNMGPYVAYKITSLISAGIAMIGFAVTWMTLKRA